MKIFKKILTAGILMLFLLVRLASMAAATENVLLWSLENPLPTPNDLYAVWGFDTNSVYAVGQDGVILYYDGNQPVLLNSPASKSLYGIWGSSPNDIFAVGDNGTILHYDGQNWSVMSSGTTVSLKDIWGSSPNDVYAVGDGGAILHYGVADQSAVYRFWSDTQQAHFYTIDEEEKEYVIATYPENVWRYEGIAFYAYPV